MPKALSYRDLTRLLEGHGFELTRVPGSHHLFTHADSGTTIMLPADSSTRAAMPSQVVAVRRVLDEGGLLAAEEFDREVRTTANGHAKASQ